ncbi:PH domain-containing protein [bacterium]|nr:PH domain-containing protein [bacterium]
MQELKPNRRYLNKQILIFSLVSGLILIFAFSIGALISLDEPKSGFVFASIFASVGLFFWIVSVLLSFPYFRSLRYEIHEDEVIVHVGIVTKSVKHVPFRTVTNIKINRGLLDRFVFNIGSLNIQTAGMSGSTGAEESLVGLENVQEIYDLVAAHLRKFRGAMSPTGAEEELPGDAGTLGDILNELKAIRGELKQ